MLFGIERPRLECQATYFNLSLILPFFKNLKCAPLLLDVGKIDDAGGSGGGRETKLSLSFPHLLWSLLGFDSVSDRSICMVL
jgi:hypothetical protein